MRGLVVGLAGAGLLAWALFTIFSSAGCPATAAPGSCRPHPTLPVLLAIPAGIILGIVGVFLGGGLLIFSALFVAIGLAALAPTILGLMPGMELFGWLFGGIFFVCGLLPVLAGLLLGKAALAKERMAAELMRGGVKGVGTILAVEDTGVSLNDNPRVTIRMRIEPLDGSAPVERSKTVTVSRVAIPRAGERYPAWFDRADPDKWMFGTDMQANAPAEVREMFERARAGGGGQGTGAAPGEAGDDPVAELERLSRLWRDGALTDAEFADAKRRLLPRLGR